MAQVLWALIPGVILKKICKLCGNVFLIRYVLINFNFGELPLATGTVKRIVAKNIRDKFHLVCFLEWILKPNYFTLISFYFILHSLNLRVCSEYKLVWLVVLVNLLKKNHANISRSLSFLLMNSNFAPEFVKKVK